MTAADRDTHDRTVAAHAWARQALGRSRTTPAEHTLLRLFGFAGGDVDDDIVRLAIAGYRDGCACALGVEGEPDRCAEHDTLASLLEYRRRAAEYADIADRLLVDLHRLATGAEEARP